MPNHLACTPPVQHVLHVGQNDIPLLGCAAVQDLCTFLKPVIVAENISPGQPCCLLLLLYDVGVAPSRSSSSSRRVGATVASSAAQALQQLSAAEEASKAGDYQAALTAYNRVVAEHPDLALAEYARLGRAIMLYQVGVYTCLQFRSTAVWPPGLSVTSGWY